MTRDVVKRLARECGFELAGVAAAEPSADLPRYRAWMERGFAGEMKYLTDRRAEVRQDPRNLLEHARSIVCVGKLYNTPGPEGGVVSRYAWGQDYHRVMRDGLERWLTTPELTPVRDPAGLALLPPAEREAWEAFWQSTRVFRDEIAASFETRSPGTP